MSRDYRLRTRHFCQDGIGGCHGILFDGSSEREMRAVVLAVSDDGGRKSGLDP